MGCTPQRECQQYYLRALFSRASYLSRDCCSPVDPNAYGDPYGRPISVASSASGGAESAWRRRQTIKRGVTRKVKLTKGNFITEYQVPTPVYSAIEGKWTQSARTTEFS